MEIQSAEKYTIEEIMFEYMKECGDYPQFANKTLKDIKCDGVIERGETKYFEDYKSRIQRLWDNVKEMFIPKDLEEHLKDGKDGYSFDEKDKEFIKELFDRSLNHLTWRKGLNRVIRKIKGHDGDPDTYKYPNGYIEVIGIFASDVERAAKQLGYKNVLSKEEAVEFANNYIYTELQWAINGFKTVFKKHLNDENYKKVESQLETYRNADHLKYIYCNFFEEKFKDDDEFWRLLEEDIDTFKEIKAFE